jgi:tetratricopeptide (TPR) repeat protein
VRYAYLHPDQFHRELPSYQRTIALARQVGDRWLLAHTLYTLGVSAMGAGELSLARQYNEEAYQLHFPLNDRLGISFSLTQLGYIAVWEGRYQDGITIYTDSLAIARELGSPVTIASNLRWLGKLAVEQDAYEHAEELLGESWRVIEEARADAYHLFWIVLEQCRIAFRRGAAGRMRQLLDTLPSVHPEELSSEKTLAVREYQAQLAFAEGRLAEAQTLLEQNLAERHAAPGKSAQYTVASEGSRMSSQRMLGYVLLAAGARDVAVLALEESLAAARTLRHALAQAEGCLALATALISLGRVQRAAPLLREALKRYQPIGSPLGVAKSLEQLGASLALAGEHTHAARLWGAAEALREQSGAPTRPADRPEHQRRINACRAALGDDAFHDAWQGGRALTWEQAAAEALALLLFEG